VYSANRDAGVAAVFEQFLVLPNLKSSNPNSVKPGRISLAIRNVSPVSTVSGGIRVIHSTLGVNWVPLNTGTAAQAGISGNTVAAIARMFDENADVKLISAAQCVQGMNFVLYPGSVSAYNKWWNFGTHDIGTSGVDQTQNWTQNKISLDQAIQNNADNGGMSFLMLQIEGTVATQPQNMFEFELLDATCCRFNSATPYAQLEQNHPRVSDENLARHIQYQKGQSSSSHGGNWDGHNDPNFFTTITGRPTNYWPSASNVRLPSTGSL
jgi:hypothetical protein